MDWGGVLTPPLARVMPDWAREDRIDFGHFRDVLTTWTAEAVATGRKAPSHLLERGELAVEEFERMLAAELARRGSPVRRPQGLLARMLAGLADLEQPMIDLVRTARAAGARTALLSNSWGENYPDSLWDGLFDIVVISGRVGMRKPEPEIFEYTLGELALPAQECVLVDDMEGNVEAARAGGMVAIHHTDPAQTVALIRDLFGLAESAAVPRVR